MTRHLIPSFAIAVTLLVALAAHAQQPLTQTLELPDFGFSLDYPGSWSTIGSTLAETETDARSADRSRFFSPKQVIVIGMDDQPLSFFHNRGLPEEATLDDLLQFNLKEFALELLAPIEEIEIFGVPALSVWVRSTETGRVGVAVQGFIELPSRTPSERGFLVTVEAPSQEILNGFVPTWQGMLASLRPIERQ